MQYLVCCGFACSSLVSRNQCDARQPNYIILNVLTIAVKMYNIILCWYCERIFGGLLSKPHLNIWAFNLAYFSFCHLKPKPNRFYTFIYFLFYTHWCIYEGPIILLGIVLSLKSLQYCLNFNK